LRADSGRQVSHLLERWGFKRDIAGEAPFGRNEGAWWIVGLVAALFIAAIFSVVNMWLYGLIALLAFVLLSAVLLGAARQWGYLLLAASIPVYTPAATWSGRVVFPWEICLAFVVFIWILESATGPRSSSGPSTGSAFDFVDLTLAFLLMLETLASLRMVGASDGTGTPAGSFIRCAEYFFIWRAGRHWIDTSPRGLRLVAGTLVLMAAFQGGLGVLQHRGYNLRLETAIDSWFFPRSYTYWLSGGLIGPKNVILASVTLSHFNTYGQYLNLCWPMVLPLLRLSTGRERLFWAMCLSCALVGVVFSYSRGALFGAIAVGALYLAIPFGRGTGVSRNDTVQEWTGPMGSHPVDVAARSVGHILVPGPSRKETNMAGRRAVAIALLIGAAALWHWMNTSGYSETMSLEGDQGRKGILLRVAGAWRPSPDELLIGGGIGKIVDVAGASAHNMYLQVLVDIGAPALAALFAFFWWTCARPIWRIAKTSEISEEDWYSLGAALAVATLCIGGLVNHFWREQPVRAQLMVVAAIASFGARGRRESPTQDLEGTAIVPRPRFCTPRAQGPSTEGNERGSPEEVD